jgi:hypothetical protein
MKRTTVLAEESLLLDAQHLAKQMGVTFTDVVREALAEYVANHRPRRQALSFEGIARRGPDAGDNRPLAERLDQALRAGVTAPGGWSRAGGPSAEGAGER